MADGPTDQPESGSSSFSAFDRLVETCRRTRGALVSVVYDETRDGDAVRDLLARDALAHVDAMLEGLVVLGRAAHFSAEELRELVRRAGILAPARPGTPEARAGEHESAHEPRVLRTLDGRTMLAAGHARVVFALIPQLPPEDVTWPRRHRSYADIPVPRSEAEVLQRAEELARVVWRVAAGDARRDEPLRRTLAFYEAGSRLSFTGFLAA